MDNNEMQLVIENMGRRARKAAAALALLSPEAKSGCLNAMADALIAASAAICQANGADVAKAKENNLSAAMIDRLTLTPERVEAMAQGLRTVAAQRDPVGRIISSTTRPNGLQIDKVSVPFGVIGIIYESRPNVTSDAAGICIKAGNAVILRGGSEAFESNMAIASALNSAAVNCGLPQGVVQLIPWTSREAVNMMLKLDRYIDLIIPRGGESLIRAVVAGATMPVLKHYKGVCHLYLDETYDIDSALKIVINAKCQRPGVCNALETLLIDRKALANFAPRFTEAMQANKVELRGDADFCKVCPTANPASEDDYYAEYLDLILAVKTVDGVDEAIEHINTYGSRHSDGILSNNANAVAAFTASVDTSTVYVNASTRFTDGGEFGMGAEIGISTDKLHARGPMGADELTSYKYIVRGNGQIR